MALHRYFQMFSTLIIILSIVNVNLIQSASTPSPCLNYCSGGGYCYKSDTGPKCICSPKWTGERCDIHRNDMQVNETQQRGHPCKEVPDYCENDGVCYVDGTQLACFCDYSHTGEFCETEVIYPCDDEDYCKNDGECIPDGEKASCKCLDGWEGKNCEKASTPTKTKCDRLGDTYCNSGTCVEVNGKQQCYCPPMKTGMRCETSIKSASSEAAPTGMPPTGMPPTGTPPTGMSSTGMPPTGTPPSGTTSGGVTCAQGPCRNGGRCFPTGNSYFCLCAAGFAGANCDAQG